ncbi:hypothetical protein halTADL_2695 [Halohasta litchfieldiae]|jgi:hypothetical protein|uniref:Uncharacterized protein n=1 Tax=Halohasta litchfieldiae TaxID=1073996 RepID=A0A1H6VWK0_9EURY|nr:hypothetical protein [Halohasta litchfieldiae]ATW89413.1 hypothetical protein halTADL_2695 [Halohasta litchfieldiae]SEJ05000.1 hypothetical protein SAMN05444271_1189 [Halohasta litchfieldiae]
MDQYFLNGKTELSPIVVITTLLLIAAFAVGFGYQLLGLML